ncbi:LA_2272 family surface repeat-containing protein [Candidatus Margulisiibacteriota bacterium]
MDKKIIAIKKHIDLKKLAKKTWKYILRFNPIVSVASDVHGLQISLFNISTGKVNGAQIGLLNNCEENVNGVQIGFLNGCAGKVNGAQLSFISNECNDGLNGLQFTFFGENSTSTGTNNGLQLVGIGLNYTFNTRGLQCAFLGLNHTYFTVKGAQVLFGGINASDNTYGFQGGIAINGTQAPSKAFQIGIYSSGVLNKKERTGQLIGQIGISNSIGIYDQEDQNTILLNLNWIRS